MIAPDRNLRNIQISTLAFLSTTLQIDHLLAGSVMDIDFNKNVDNFDNIRGRSPSSSRVTSKSTSIISKTFSIHYYERMEIQNNFPEEELRESINSSQPSYNDQHQESYYVNKTIDPVLPQGPQHVLNETLP